MEFKLTTISYRYTIWLFSIYFPLVGLSIFLLIQFDLNRLLFGTLFASSLIISCYLAFHLTKKKTLILINESFIHIENTKLDWNEMKGYYISRESPIMTMIEIRKNDNKKFSITSLNFGKTGKYFELFLSEFEKLANRTNNNIEQSDKTLTYFDMHQGQRKGFKILYIVGTSLLVLVNVFYIFMTIFTDISFNWKILFVNISYFAFYSFYRRNKK